MQNASNIISATVVPLSGFLGGKLGLVTANAAPIDPLWGQILGPVGFLIGCLFAIKWLTKRLEKSEETTAKNQETLITVLVQTKTVIEQNSEILEDVKQTLSAKKGN
jgi:5-methylthioribose kinase